MLYEEAAQTPLPGTQAFTAPSGGIDCTRTKAREKYAIGTFLQVLILLVMAFSGLNHEFWGPDEVREAEIAREMYLTGDYVVPQFSGQPFLEKPPLTYWVAAIGFYFSNGPGVDQSRLSVPLWTLLTVFGTWWLGCRLGGRVLGFTAALIISSFQFWVLISHSLIVDLPLAAAATLALCFFWWGYTNQASWRLRVGYLLCFVSFGLGILSKGFIGVVLPASGIFVFLLWRRDWKSLKQFMAPWNILSILIIIGPWMYLLWARSPELFSVFFWDNNVLRFVSSAADHAKPFWYYLITIFSVLAPWSLFLIPAVFRLCSFLKAEKTADQEKHHQLVFSALLAPFLVLSIASAKRELYLLPLLPILAILIAFWLHQFWGAITQIEEKLRRYGLYLILGVAVLIWPLACFWAVREENGILITFILTGLVGGFSIKYYLSPKRRKSIPFPQFVAVMAIFAFLIFSLPTAVQFINRKNNSADLITFLNSNLSGREIHGYRLGERSMAVICFASDNIVTNHSDLNFLPTHAKNGPTIWAINQIEYRLLVNNSEWPPSAKVFATQKILGQTIVFVSNSP